MPSTCYVIQWLFVTTFYPLLIYVGLAGSAALLGMELLPRLRAWRKAAVAFWLTLVTLLWLALPREGQWLLSLWQPSTILGGQILLDMTPALWLLGLTLGALLSGAAWLETVERRAPLPLSGALVLMSLLTLWFALLGGSLLTTLAAWGVYDLLWGVVGLMSGSDGERVTFGLALHGIASLLLWSAFLLLSLSGNSALWRLMWLTPSVQSLLLIAAVIRMGFYPFHIVFPQRPGALRPLGLVSLMGPLLGGALLARLLTIPGELVLPGWLPGWAALSLFWGGLMAWYHAHAGSRAILWAGYALLGPIVVGALLSRAAENLLLGMATWVAAGALLFMTQRRNRREIAWAWPATCGVLFMIGAPPSPLGELYRTALAGAPWSWRLPMLIGGMGVAATLLTGLQRPAQGRLTPPWPWLSLGRMISLLLPLLALFSVTLMAPALPFSWSGWALWLVGCIGGGILLIWQSGLTRAGLHIAGPAWELLDLRWFYRALWQGLENLLSFIRVIDDVVEGAGALLWSFLVLLLVLVVMVMGS